MRYRRRALSELDAPEQLDQAVRLATVPGWLITAVLVLVVGGAGAWAGTATIPRTIDARGLITHAAGVSRLDAAVGGLITEVWARVGQRITKGSRLYSLTTASGNLRVVNAPWDAYVMTWLVGEGQLARPGVTVAEVARLDAPGDQLQARVYLLSKYAPVVRAGVPVEIEADAAPVAAFGTLEGTVVSVGQFPESESSLRAFLGDSAAIPRLLTGGSVVAVTVSLAADPASPSGLRWSKAGPPFRLGLLSELTARFTVAEEHPIEWLVG